jgi:hypothetical protein
MKARTKTTYKFLALGRRVAAERHCSRARSLARNVVDMLFLGAEAYEEGLQVNLPELLYL